jgi:hypothetical protein
MPSISFPRTDRLSAAALGWSAKATNGAVTGSEFDATGANSLVLYCHFTRVAATGTISLTVQAYDDLTAAWVTLQTSAIVAGAVTFSAMSLDKATGSASQAYEIRLTNLAFKKMRVNMPAAITAAGATDLLTITGELLYQEGG